MAEAIVDIEAAMEGESKLGVDDEESKGVAPLEEKLSQLSSILSEVEEARKEFSDHSTADFIQNLSQVDAQGGPPASLISLLSNFAEDFKDTGKSDQASGDQSASRPKDILKDVEEIVGDEEGGDILENWDGSTASGSKGSQEERESLFDVSGEESSESGSDAEGFSTHASSLKGEQMDNLVGAGENVEDFVLPEHVLKSGAQEMDPSVAVGLDKSLGVVNFPDRIQIQGQGELLVRGWEDIRIGESGKMQAPVVAVNLEGFSAPTKDVVVVSHLGNQYFIRIDIFKENISKLPLSQIVEDFGSLNAVGAITGAASVENYTIVAKKVVVDASGSRIPYIIGDIYLNKGELAEKGTKGDVSRFAIVELHGKKYQIDLALFENNILEKSLQYLIEEHGKLLDGHSSNQGLSHDSQNDEIVYTMLGGEENMGSKVLVDAGDGEYEVEKANFENLLSRAPLDQILSQHGTLRTSPLEGREDLKVCVTNDIDHGEKVITSPVAGEITYHVRERVFEEVPSEGMADKPKRRRRKKAFVMVEGVEYEVDLQTFESKAQMMNVKEIVAQFGHKTTWNQSAISNQSRGMLIRQEMVLSNGTKVEFFLQNISGSDTEVEDQKVALVEYKGGMYEVDYTVFIHLIEERTIDSIVKKFGSLRTDLGGHTPSEPEAPHTAYKTTNVKHQQGAYRSQKSELCVFQLLRLIYLCNLCIKSFFLSQL